MRKNGHGCGDEWCFYVNGLFTPSLNIEEKTKKREQKPVEFNLN